MVPSRHQSAGRCSQDPGTEVSCKAKDEPMQRCVLRKTVMVVKSVSCIFDWTDICAWLDRIKNKVEGGKVKLLIFVNFCPMI